jgi:hypothetical protein
VSADYVPTRVVFYTWSRGQERSPWPIAEFRWTPSTGVMLTILNKEYGSGALGFLQNGVNCEQERRMVSPEEGPAFMRALLAQGNSSNYYWFRDNSVR